MKVGTDSIILGSAIKIKSRYKHILDVGTGTGLLSLMIAQKSSNPDITAVEIDSNAYHQAKINIDKCKWSNKINLIHADAKQLEIDNLKKEIRDLLNVKNDLNQAKQRFIKRGREQM